MPAVVWEINVPSILTIVGSVVAILRYIWTVDQRSITAERLAREARELVDERNRASKEDAIARSEDNRKAIADLAGSIRMQGEQITLLNGSLAAHRETVAQNYVSRQQARESEERLITCIDRLAERLDRLLEKPRS